MDELMTWLRTQLDADQEFATVAPKMAATRRAQLLREVEAKRHILNLHRTDRPGEKGGSCVTCFDTAYPETGPIMEPYPCETVQWLASMYADRDGYRDKWAPG